MAATRRPKNPDLTYDERLCLELLAQGYMNKEIAHMLELTLHSVEWHCRSIRIKIGVENRVQMGVWAAKHGYV